MLLNDFRAGVALKEHGVVEHVTIETILDIDAVAERGDSVIIDSDEDDKGKLELYVENFKHVWRFAKSPDDYSLYGETVWRCDVEQGQQSSVVVHPRYLEAPQSKEDRLLFFLGDSDHEKVILNHSDFFDAFKEKMELLLGHYFFVKYEERLAEVFHKIIEPEEYYEVLKEYQNILTSSVHIAIEAKANGLNVLFLALTPLDDCKKRQLINSNIPISQKVITNRNIFDKENSIINNIENKIMNISINYM